MTLPTDEAFYGGAAGGWKSEALLMAALQLVDMSGYNALILRRSFAELAKPGALIPRSLEWLGGTAARWNAQSYTWTFPSGATLSFGYLQHSGDEYQYNSAEYQFIGFDELTAFPELQYRFMFSRKRRLADSSIPTRMRAASNPLDIGHEWVRTRFISPGDPERPFIRALLQDNPFIDREEYIRSLMHLDPITRQRLLEGDWDIRDAGSMFRREWLPLLDVAPVGLQTVRFWDLAASEAKRGQDPDWTVGAKLGLDRQRYGYVLDIARVRTTAQQVEQLAQQCAMLDGRQTIICIEQEPGASGKSLIDHWRRSVLPGSAVYGVPSTGSKVVRANPLSSQMQAGNVSLIRGAWIPAFLDELEAFPEGPHDDQVDAVASAWNKLAQVGIGQIDREIEEKDTDRKQEMHGVLNRTF